MLLRSSSTPVLGSLLQTFSESPGNNHHHHHQSELHSKHTPNSIHAKISCSNGGSQDFRKSLFHSSPSFAEINGITSGSRSGFRRVQSDGNLEGLADASYNVDEFSLAKRSGRRNSGCTLESIPSLSVHRLRTSLEDDSGDDEEFEEEEEEEYDYSPTMVENMVLEQVRGNGNGNGSLGLQNEGKMYLATGIGAFNVDFAVGDGNGSGGGGRGSLRPVAFDRDGGDSRDVSMEEHYKRMLEENPGDPLFLRNYAQFLYQIKGDVGAAEEYYSRAILADQEDGETLSQYAKIIWETHHDRERAGSYFQRAVRVSSQDSHIHAAYAKFLWDTEEEEEEEEEENGASSGILLHQGFMASATA